MTSTTGSEDVAPWREHAWLDPLEDFQVLENAPEVHAARSTAMVADDAGESTVAGAVPVAAEARISFTDGTPEIVTVGEDRVPNEARRHAARNALIVLRTQAPALAYSLDRRQAKNADKRQRRAASRRRRAERASAAAAELVRRAAGDLDRR